MSRHDTQPLASQSLTGQPVDLAAQLTCEQIDRRADRRLRRRDRRIIAAYHAETARRARTRTVELVLTGYHVGQVPYGFRSRRRTSSDPRRRAKGTLLAVEPAEAATVAMAFAWRTRDHLGFAEIARRLNAVRYPRPVHPVTQVEVPWTGRQVAALLANPVYTGRSVWGRARDGRRRPVELWVLSARREYVAIVSDGEFLAAQGDDRHRSVLATRFSIDAAGLPAEGMPARSTAP